MSPSAASPDPGVSPARHGSAGRSGGAVVEPGAKRTSAMHVPRGMTAATRPRRDAAAAPLESRWQTLMPHRRRLMFLAASRGAGQDTEDVVQEALLRAARFERLDERRPWPFLAVVTIRLVADLHRRSARDVSLGRHAALIPHPQAFDDDLLDRDEAAHAAALLRRVASPEIARIMADRANGASWKDLAVLHGVSMAALETRVRRAVRGIRTQIEDWRR